MTKLSQQSLSNIIQTDYRVMNDMYSIPATSMLLWQETAS